jgi:ribosome biogenesis GTPase
VGKKLEEFKSKSHFPVVGDWVEVKEYPNANFATIENIFVRENLIERGANSSRDISQKIAANIDNALIVVPLRSDLNLRRIERYVTILCKAKVKPILVLSKADQFEGDKEEIIEDLKSVLGDKIHDFFIISSKNGVGIDKLLQFIGDGNTSILLGCSGVGKSSLINKIIGVDVQKTKAVRTADDKGRHTTVSRSLHLTPSNGVIIDTPGIRGLSLSVSVEDVDECFSDVVGMIKHCKFNDCGHKNEPGCEINLAIENGDLDHGRWNSYLKQQNEAMFFERKNNNSLKKKEHEQWKKNSMNSRKDRQFRYKN